MNAELTKHIELLIGSIGVIIGVFFSIFLFFTRKNRAKANLFLAIYLAAFSLRTGKSLFHNYLEIDPVVRTFFLTLLLCVGPSLWLYTLYTMEPARKGIIQDFIHFIPFILLAGLCWLIPNNGSWLFGIFYDFLTGHMFCYTLFGLLWLGRYKQINKSPESRKLFAWLVSFLCFNLVIIILYFLISKVIIPYYIGFSFFYSLLIIYFSFWALSDPALLKYPIEKYRKSNIDRTQAAKLIAQLKALMLDKKPFLNPSLSLTMLSEELGVSSKELSQAINQIESLNYSQFIAKYRIEEVQRLLLAPSHSKFTIASIAYDSGFSSISSFNSAFKKHTGTTASDFRKMSKSN